MPSPLDCNRTRGYQTGGSLLLSNSLQCAQDAIWWTGFECHILNGVTIDGNHVPIEGFATIELLAIKKMKMLTKYFPLIFSEDSASKFIDIIKRLAMTVPTPHLHYPAINATVIDRILVLLFSHIWKWRSSFQPGAAPPTLALYLDLKAAEDNDEPPGLTAVAFSYDNWKRGIPVAIGRGKARACDILKINGRSANPKTDTRPPTANNAAKSKKGQANSQQASHVQDSFQPEVEHMDYPPTSESMHASFRN